MRPELYQRMLHDISEQVRLADDLGYDSVSFTEHHFHIEGFEVSNNPVLLDLYFAMQTKCIRVGQLGIVLQAANPIRVAEDIAMLDQMTRTLEKLRRRPPIDWVFCYTYNSLVPHDVLMKTIERFWTEVMPRVA